MKLICLGDSLTEGHDIGENKNWVSLLNHLVSYEVINSGISGDTTTGMLSRFRHDVLEHQPSHLIILGGSNDIYFEVPLSVIISNLYSMTRLAKSNGIEFILGLPPKTYYKTPIRSIGNFFDMDQSINHYREVLRSFCIEHDLNFIDFNDNLSESSYLDDCLHPDETGHHIMMETILNYTKKITP
ncbi:MAG: hypothetical protein JEZ08_16315 [Clostridiales bacterium]|nr:hypothetical protein [Clostridiales bacterium]